MADEVFSIRELIAKLEDLKEDGFRTLSESELYKVLDIKQSKAEMLSGAVDMAVYNLKLIVEDFKYSNKSISWEDVSSMFDKVEAVYCGLEKVLKKL